MMFVASFVMHPGNGISQYFPFLFIWTSIALVIPCTRQKFCRTILGKVMPQTLPKNARLPTVPNHQMPMACNGSKMIPCALHAHTCSTSFSFLLAKACSHHSDHYHYNTEASEEQVNFCDYLHPLIDKFFQPQWNLLTLFPISDIIILYRKIGLKSWNACCFAHKGTSKSMLLRPKKRNPL